MFGFIPIYIKLVLHTFVVVLEKEKLSSYNQINMVELEIKPPRRGGMVDQDYLAVLHP